MSLVHKFSIIDYFVKYFHERVIPIMDKVTANILRNIKSIINEEIFNCNIVNCLIASVKYVRGFTRAIIWIHSGIKDIGKKVLLANINGIVIKLTNCMGLSILVDLMENARNTDEKPTLSRNIAA